MAIASTRGKEGGDEGPDVGHEPHQPRQDTPQDCVRYADQPKTNGDDDAKANVERNLQKEEAAEPRRRIIEGGGGALKVASTCQPDEAIADVLALQEDEQQKQQHQSSGRKRRQ